MLRGGTGPPGRTPNHPREVRRARPTSRRIPLRAGYRDESMLRALVIGIVAGFCATQLANFVTTVYLHRGLAHRALGMRPWLQGAFKAVIWLTTGMRPRQWVAVHRKH